MYITFNKESKQVAYIGKEKPVAYSNTLELAETATVPEKYDYLTVENVQECTERVNVLAIPNPETGEEETTTETIECEPYLTCDLVAHFIAHTEEQIAAQKQAEYESLVESLIRQKYSLSNELAILRQKDSKPEEYAAYNAYAEECKVRAKENIYG